MKDIEKLVDAVIRTAFIPLEASGRHVHVTQEQAQKIALDYLGIALEDAQRLETILKEKHGVKEVFIGYTGAVIGSHSGPGTLALFFLGEHR